MKLATSMYRSPSIKQSHGSKSWLHSWNIDLKVRNSRHMLLGIMYAGTFAHTVPQPPYSICEAKSSLELRQELLRAGTEDRVAIGSVVLMLCCFYPTCLANIDSSAIKTAYMIKTFIHGADMCLKLSVIRA